MRFLDTILSRLFFIPDLNESLEPRDSGECPEPPKTTITIESDSTNVLNFQNLLECSEKTLCPNIRTSVSLQSSLSRQAQTVIVKPYFWPRVKETSNIGAQRLINLEIQVLEQSLKSSNVELG